MSYTSPSRHSSPYTTSPQRSTAFRGRNVVACAHCRQRKARCTGGTPCSNCAYRQQPCIVIAVSPEENQEAQRRKNLPPTTHRPPPQHDSSTLSPSTARRHLPLLGHLDLTSLTTGSERQGPASAPLPQPDRSFDGYSPAPFFKRVSVGASEATYTEPVALPAAEAGPAKKPVLHLNEHCATFDEIGQAVMRQYHVIFPPLGTTSSLLPVPPVLHHSHSDSELSSLQMSFPSSAPPPPPPLPLLTSTVAALALYSSTPIAPSLPIPPFSSTAGTSAPFPTFGSTSTSPSSYAPSLSTSAGSTPSSIPSLSSSLPATSALGPAQAAGAPETGIDWQAFGLEGSGANWSAEQSGHDWPVSPSRGAGWSGTGYSR